MCLTYLDGTPVFCHSFGLDLAPDLQVYIIVSLLAVGFFVAAIQMRIRHD